MPRSAESESKVRRARREARWLEFIRWIREWRAAIPEQPPLSAPPQITAVPPYRGDASLAMRDSSPLASHTTLPAPALPRPTQPSQDNVIDMGSGGQPVSPITFPLRSVVDIADTSVIDISDTSVIELADTSVIEIADTSVIEVTNTSVADISADRQPSPLDRADGIYSRGFDAEHEAAPANWVVAPESRGPTEIPETTQRADSPPPEDIYADPHQDRRQPHRSGILESHTASPLQHSRPVAYTRAGTLATRPPVYRPTHFPLPH